MSVSVCTHISGTTRSDFIKFKFLCTLPVAMARSYSGGAAVGLRYVLPFVDNFLSWALWRRCASPLQCCVYCIG